MHITNILKQTHITNTCAFTPDFTNVMRPTWNPNMCQVFFNPSIRGACDVCESTFVSFCVINGLHANFLLIYSLLCGIVQILQAGVCRFVFMTCGDVC